MVTWNTLHQCKIVHIPSNPNKELDLGNYLGVIKRSKTSLVKKLLIQEPQTLFFNPFTMKPWAASELRQVLMTVLQESQSRIPNWPHHHRFSLHTPGRTLSNCGRNMPSGYSPPTGEIDPAGTPAGIILRNLIRYFIW